jgi:hypothetical protein
VALYGAATAVHVGRRAAATLVCYLAIAGLFAAGLVFLTLAAYRALTLGVGNIYAALIVGSFYLAAGLVTLLVVQMRRD